ncbi:condensin subunit Smc [Kytococcus aerolatus]|uniref:Chromosome partition protein Smc n=1 Tax=Kytococcus aerolatus TaxID=592308 RepID=A0A212U1M5_9MICO|nr:chromosome segregation protein SMC [Kytococcus aerolatus]SNC72152.1 condensin subunit Smc [Kytococcus aerolatus]
MYVTSLTMKGFKSFASATRLELEPGITAIVGPNGSGKSNVVDALAWVMGEQGAKSLRGGKMEDVIFAGTSGRPPLGRAEVSMTIDNTDGALPIDYSEVTISRTMFRTGGSEYAINGTPCRLLDVQELLSDSGIGREMHVIVGQGQLDAVLRATPEERRGFIEEAAGVLKHRRRKEKALRKLDAMEGDLARVRDLTAEVRRQLGPLGRQAATARRAAVIHITVRDARARLLAADLVEQQASLAADLADERAAVARREEAEGALHRASQGVDELEAAVAAADERHDGFRQAWFELGSLADRARAAGRLAQERGSLAERDAAEAEQRSRTGRDPEQLEAQAAELREQETELRDRIEGAEAELARATAAKDEAEAAHRAEVQRLERLARAAADRREGLATLGGQVEVRRSRVASAEAEIERLVADIGTQRSAAQEATRRLTELEAGMEAAESGEEDLDAAWEAAQTAVDEATGRLENARNLLNTARQAVQRHEARVEGLAVALQRRDGSAELVGSGAPEGVLGELTDHLGVDPGQEAALAVALGSVAGALVVADAEAARRALDHLAEREAGQATLLLPGGTGDDELVPLAGADIPSHPSPLPEGAAWAVDRVRVSRSLAPALVEVLTGIVLAADAALARAVLEAVPAARAVATTTGELWQRHRVTGGSASGPSTVELAAEHDRARGELEAARVELSTAEAERDAAQAAVVTARPAAEQALAALHESDARMAAVTDELAQAAGAQRAAEQAIARAEEQLAARREQLATDRVDLEALEARLATARDEAESAPDPAEQTDERERLATEAARARTAETEARLQARTADERLKAIAGRADALVAQARNELLARQDAARRARQRRQAAASAREVVEESAELAARIEAAREEAEAGRQEAEVRRAEARSELVAQRTRIAELTERVRELTDAVHRDEVARAELRLRVEALQQRAHDELGMEAEDLVAEYGPEHEVPVLDDDGEQTLDEEGNPATVPFVRDEQAKRLRRAERDLKALGQVNPLALEEYAAMEERHQFLAGQLEDLVSSKQALLDLVEEVDERVRTAFVEAYEDVAREFEGVFGRLFPGGEGRLELTDPQDMLTTGIEVHARPPGKKVKRLSLLSGGERSLTAVALLVSIFKARPSPFYIMDEVEAALDDSNLGRLIQLFEELRDSSQLIVITHQKRTMEVADALYGVSMKGDGISQVVSQRLKDVDLPRA